MFFPFRLILVRLRFPHVVQVLRVFHVVQVRSGGLQQAPVRCDWGPFVSVKFVFRNRDCFSCIVKHISEISVLNWVKLRNTCSVNASPCISCIPRCLRAERPGTKRRRASWWRLPSPESVVSGVRAWRPLLYWPQSPYTRSTLQWPSADLKLGNA